MKAAAVVQDLLSLARRNVVLNFEVLNINRIVRDYLNSPEYEHLQLNHPSIGIQTHLETGLSNITGSEIHLKKTIMNLVTNAAEAQPKSGYISITTTDRYVDRSFAGYEDVKEGNYVKFTIQDKGEGIAAEDLKKIFEPFYTKKKMGRSGTGLGMSVVWGAVHDHNGYIDVTSSPNEGTRFDLYFPITKEELVTRTHRARPEEYMGHQEKILIVDDIPEQREIAESILKRLDYDVKSVASGEEAIDHVKHSPIDLILLDMIMDPGIDGLETYQHIIKFHPGMRAIIASGFSETDRVKEARRLGVRDYIRKPFTLEKLAIAVKEALERS